MLSLYIQSNRSYSELQEGFHRYELNFSDLKLVVQIKQHPVVTNGRPRYVEVANRAVDMNSRARLLCYPRGSFYQLSPALPMKDRGITKTYFRTCLALRPRSQAGFSLYSFPTISVRSKPTFVPLRYIFAGYRPSKTAHLALSLNTYAVLLGKLRTFKRVVLH